MDEEKISFVKADYANVTCRTCDHVIAGKKVTVFAHPSDGYIAVCSDTCSKAHSRVSEIGSIIDLNPEILPVLHIPVNVLARLHEKKWRIDLLEDNFRPSENDFLYCSRRLEDIRDREYYVWVLSFAKDAVHYVEFDMGIKFLAMYESVEDAKFGLRPFMRLYHKMQYLRAEEIFDLAYENKQNYLGIVQENIECIIVDPVIEA